MRRSGLFPQGVINKPIPEELRKGPKIPKISGQQTDLWSEE
jgi:hypothetical protein